MKVGWADCSTRQEGYLRSLLPLVMPSLRLKFLQSLVQNTCKDGGQKVYQRGARTKVLHPYQLSPTPEFVLSLLLLRAENKSSLEGTSIKKVSIHSLCQTKSVHFMREVRTSTEGGTFRGTCEWHQKLNDPRRCHSRWPRWGRSTRSRRLWCALPAHQDLTQVPPGGRIPFPH